MAEEGHAEATPQFHIIAQIIKLLKLIEGYGPQSLGSNRMTSA